MKNLLSYVLIILSFSTEAQIITTSAGNGVSAFGGDGGPATSANLNTPWDVETDEFGNFFIADRNNHRIRKVDANGIITTIAGNGTMGFSGDGGLAINAAMGMPTGIALDSSGNIYFVDYFNYRIRKIDTQGIIHTIAGNGVNDYAGDGGPAVLASISLGFGLGCDRYGNVYTADIDHHVVRKIDTSGIITTIAGNGAPGAAGDGGPAVNAQLYGPISVRVDKNGNIYIADYFNHKIRKIDSSGIINTIAGNQFGTSGFGGDGGPATLAFLSGPTDVAMDADGNIYISEWGNSRIRKIDVNGIINTVAGNGNSGFSGDGWLATYAAIGGPAGIAVDNFCNLYIATTNGRIRKVTGSCVTGIANNWTKNTEQFAAPNPVHRNKIVTIPLIFSSDEKVTLQVFNINAQCLFSCQLNSNEKYFDLIADFDPGLYHYVVRSHTIQASGKFSIVE